MQHDEGQSTGDGPPQAAKAPKPSLVQLRNRSEHKLAALSTGRWWCSRCRLLSPQVAEGDKAAGRRLRAWLAAGCQETGASPHGSHSLVVAGQSAIVCCTCGIWGRHRLGKLRQPCRAAPRTAADRTTALRARRGLAPEPSLGLGVILEVVT